MTNLLEKIKYYLTKDLCKISPQGLIFLRKHLKKIEIFFIKNNKKSQEKSSKILYDFTWFFCFLNKVLRRNVRNLDKKIKKDNILQKNVQEIVLLNFWKIY